MPKRKSDKGYYLIKSESKDYNYGAFPKTDKGQQDAYAYNEKLKKQGGDAENFYIVEK